MYNLHIYQLNTKEQNRMRSQKNHIFTNIVPWNVSKTR